jgi:hypothetical protein
MSEAGASTSRRKGKGGGSALAASILATLAYALPALAAPVADKRLTYSEYTNLGYGYSICYPGNVFIPQGETISRDGQLFVAADGAELHVHADYNIPFRTIQDDFLDTVSAESKNGAVTFKLQEGNWYVVSGMRGASIFYRKTILAGEEFITFRAMYPAAANPVYSDVVTTLAQCLKPSLPSQGRP